MAYIYKITNDVNGKIYIGKTENSIEKRFNKHCQDAFRPRCEKRPLYAAMRKYGVEHFHIELVEETNSPEEREIYWIEQYGSFKYGYNATMGGDGKKYIDYDLVVATYRERYKMPLRRLSCWVFVKTVFLLYSKAKMNQYYLHKRFRCDSLEKQLICILSKENFYAPFLLLTPRQNIWYKTV